MGASGRQVEGGQANADHASCGKFPSKMSNFMDAGEVVKEWLHFGYVLYSFIDAPYASCSKLH